MSPTRQPRLGSVVWAEVEDVNGFVKVRPVAIVTPTAEIAPGKTVRVVAITTRLSSPLPDDHVLLPWDPQGKSRSGLRRRCAAVASWQVEISFANVQQVVGILPPTVIAELLAKIAATLPPPSASPVSGLGDPENQPSL
ncbi:MAG TPA: type II toxin-antitoxin system PemK/MazF family toxin [Isosphaeraceae bacterium]|nr:type II toxin-antitoxin system PemK/MazF family toxin [Isosphaeraceae bacterium]